ncbi:Rieske (2Fe-2S) protein [Sulfuriflexus sp.]|uniref:Rieske (2Fe-2S) protein n=1 Tax=Sulfuriflexus sp. TaxID=2015443 RepID=UPI0028CD8199|nr:Rieske 2Fe-2S domain-containing protein [Sulfuriflexus sp.]MDT8404692.1 Rieske 2Fe-2S domain-containing protein [Sulfuriflexus sp.]
MSVIANNKRRICRLAEIEDGGARGFDVADGETVISLLIVRQGKQVYAYCNSCPHTGVNLEWLPDQFLDSGARYIQCAMHGARFRIDDGLCVSGPCTGDSLQRIAVNLQGGEIVCTLPMPVL